MEDIVKNRRKKREIVTGLVVWPSPKADEATLRFNVQDGSLIGTRIVKRPETIMMSITSALASRQVASSSTLSSQIGRSPG